MEQETTLARQVSELKYRQRQELIELVANYPDPDERTAGAQALLRELSLHQVFDRFTKEQNTALLNLLLPIAQPPAEATEPVYGEGAVSKIPPPYPEQ